MQISKATNVFLPFAYIATGLFIGISLQAHSKPESSRASDVVRTRKLELVDNKGRVRASLHTIVSNDEDLNGHPQFVMKDKEGETTIAVNPFLGSILFVNSKGGMSIGLNEETGKPIVVSTLKDKLPEIFDLTKSK